MSLWYCETVTMTGRWTPCTQPEKPDTASYMGALRIRTASGQLGPRVRRLIEVPAGLAGLPLNDLRHALWGDEDAPAVAPPLGDAA